MSLERAVFAPLERLAGALHPYRWHFVLVALSATATLLALAYAGEEYWPEHSSRVLGYAFPIVVHLAAWGWGARFLVAWYGTRPGGPRFLRRVPPELLDPFAPVKRVWHLFVLLAFFLVPGLVWFAWFRVRGLEFGLMK
jgi:hypothetical protein